MIHVKIIFYPLYTCKYRGMGPLKPLSKLGGVLELQLCPGRVGRVDLRLSAGRWDGDHVDMVKTPLQGIM